MASVDQKMTNVQGYAHLDHMQVRGKAQHQVVFPVMQGGTEERVRKIKHAKGYVL